MGIRTDSDGNVTVKRSSVDLDALVRCESFEDAYAFGKECIVELRALRAENAELEREIDCAERRCDEQRERAKHAERERDEARVESKHNLMLALDASPKAVETCRKMPYQNDRRYQKMREAIAEFDAAIEGTKSGDENEPIVHPSARPSFVLRATLSLSRSESSEHRWCASYGELHAYGRTPDLAFAAFDRAFVEQCNP